MIKRMLAVATACFFATPTLAQPVTNESVWTGLESDVQSRFEDCEIDADELNRLLNLPQRAFDQDSEIGWRAYARRDGCWRASAELILIWLSHNPNAEGREWRHVVRWHAGQMYANAGRYDDAIPLFEAAKSDDDAWNHYADGTVAFLRGDRAAFDAARGQLATMRPSEEERAARRRFLDENPNIRMPEGFVTEPQNLPVLDRMGSCWGAPYYDAYGGTCEAR